MKQQTAVEWLVEVLFPDNEIFGISNALIYQAKEMFEQQVIDAWENGYEHGACVNEDKNKFHGVQYYNETYNNETTNND
jgi:hypothetical protein